MTNSKRWMVPPIAKGFASCSNASSSLSSASQDYTCFGLPLLSSYKITPSLLIWSFRGCDASSNQIRSIGRSVSNSSQRYVSLVFSRMSMAEVATARSMSERSSESPLALEPKRITFVTWGFEEKTLVICFLILGFSFKTTTSLLLFYQSSSHKARRLIFT